MKHITGKNIKYLALLLFVILALFGLVGKLSAQIGGGNKVTFPEKEIKVGQYAFPEYDYFEVGYWLYEGSLYYLCPNAPYMVAVPRSLTVYDDRIEGEINGIEYRVIMTDQTIEELMEDTLPTMVKQPLLGKAPRYKEKVSVDSTLFECPIHYRGGVVTTKISVREVKEYAVAYLLELGELSIAMYASTEDPLCLEEAEHTIWGMAVSMFHTEAGNTDESAESKAKWRPHVRANKAATFSYDYPVENRYYLTDGVCILEWTNIDISEHHIYFEPEKDKPILSNKEYSAPGRYVFEVGNLKPGEYNIEADVSEPLENMMVFFTEKETYLAQLKEAEEEYYVPHDPGD